MHRSISFIIHWFFFSVLIIISWYFHFLFFLSSSLSLVLLLFYFTFPFLFRLNITFPISFNIPPLHFFQLVWTFNIHFSFFFCIHIFFVRLSLSIIFFYFLLCFRYFPINFFPIYFYNNWFCNLACLSVYLIDMILFTVVVFVIHLPNHCLRCLYRKCYFVCFTTNWK